MNKQIVALAMLMVVVFASCKKESLTPASSLQSIQNASGSGAVAK